MPTAKRRSAAHRVLIVGGGFSGVQCASVLARTTGKDVDITLVSNRPEFQYYATLYRLIVGHPVSDVAIPLSSVFNGTRVRVVRDTVTSVDLQKKTVTGTGSYGYDTLVLALGSEPAYFGIPGMQESAFTFSSVDDARRIKEHLHKTIAAAANAEKDEKAIAGRIAIIGGGATGIELAGELPSYARDLAKKYGLDPSYITVELIEALPRILALIPEDMARRVHTRLAADGVNIHVNRSVLKKDKDTVVMADIQLKAKTVIWTAGVKAHALPQTLGAETDKRGRILVDEHLQMKDRPGVFVMGDLAATQYAGMAQTAVYDAAFVARCIARSLAKQPMPAYTPKKPAFAIPVGRYWAVVKFGPLKVYGPLGWLLRKAADARAFHMMLPLSLAVRMTLAGLRERPKR